MENSVFDSVGIVVFGYTLFALALAIAIGVVWRRAVPGLMVGFAGYFVARIFVDTWLRQRLASTHELTWHGREPAALHHAWVITEYPSNAHGEHVAVLCFKAGAARGLPIPACPRNALQYAHAVFHPASQFWQLQLVETAIFGGAAVHPDRVLRLVDPAAYGLTCPVTPEPRRGWRYTPTAYAGAVV